MSQEVSLQLIGLCGLLITSLTTVALAFIAMQRAGKAVAIGSETHQLINSRFDQWKREQELASLRDAESAKARGNLQGRADLLAEQQAAAGQRTAGNIAGRAELAREQEQAKEPY